MAQPKQKSSKSRKNMRRSQWKLTAINLSVCPQCKHPKPGHQVCPNCGSYKGREVVHVD